MILAKPALAAIVAAVTTWPREGVVLLILIVLLFAIAAVLANRRTGRPAPPDERVEVIGPPGSEDPAGGNVPPRDV
jgi:type II secretory pathway component PulF